jgi:T-complex protein 1 subunit eta
MDTSQVRGQMLSNISTCTAVADTVRTTLGRRGMDKLIHDDKGTTISNDGATIIRLLDIIHPAAKILVDIAKSQDSEVSIRLPASLSVDVAVIAVITPSMSSP